MVYFLSWNEILKINLGLAQLMGEWADFP